MASDLMRLLILATVASSAAMFLVLVLRKTIRHRFGAHAAYALWALVPVSAVVAFLPAPPAPISMQVMPMVAGSDLVGSMSISPLPVLNAAASPWLGAAWFAGTLAALLILAWQQRRFVRRLGRLSVIGVDTLRAQATAGCPALLGAWRPRVVLPADFEQRYSAVECELIVAHERTHRARGDAQINAFAATLRCAFWFNPLVYFVASRFRFDQELSCDAAVISRFPEARRAYAGAMLKAQLAEFGLPFGCHWQFSHPLKERIAMLKQPLPGRARAALGATVVAVLISGGTYVAWAAQPPAPPDWHGQPVASAQAGVPIEPASYAYVPNAQAAAKTIAAVVDPSVNSAQESKPLATPGALREEHAVSSRGKAVSHKRSDAVRVAVASADNSNRSATRVAAAADGAGDNRASTETSSVSNDVSRSLPFIPPRVVHRWKPVYPEDAYRAQLEGESSVLVTIAADGSLKDASITTSSGSASLDAATLEAVKRYNFSAAEKGGARIEAQAIVTVDWKIGPALVLSIASGMTRNTGL